MDKITAFVKVCLVVVYLFLKFYDLQTMPLFHCQCDIFFTFA